MSLSKNQKNFKIHVAPGYRWSYGDADEETLLSGVHDVNVDDLPEHVDSERLIHVLAFSDSGVDLVDEDGYHLVQLVMTPEGKAVQKGVEICGACRGCGPTGEEGNYDLLGDSSVCELCGYDNKDFDPGHIEVREQEPGREPGEPVE